MTQAMNLRMKKVHYCLYGNLIIQKLKNMMSQIYVLMADITTYLLYLMEQVSKHCSIFNMFQCHLIVQYLICFSVI